MRHRVTALSLVSIVCQTACGLGGDVAVVTTFPGNTGPGWKQTIDVAGSIGPEHVVDFDVASFVVHDKATGEVLQRLSSREFWQQVEPVGRLTPQANANDSRIIYDPLSERWFACAAGTTEPDCFLAVSSTSNPLETWHGAKLPLPRINPYMKLGVDRNGLYVCSCNGNPDFSKGTNCYVLPKQDAIADGGPVLTRGQTFANLQFSTMPALDPDPDKPADAPMILLANEFWDEVCSELYMYKVTWSDGTASISDALTIPLSQDYLTPNNSTPAMEAFQPESGPRLRAGGGGRRLDSVFVRNGSVFGCNGAKRTTDSRPGVLWYEVRISDGSLVQEGFVDSAERDFIYPSIAVDSRGNIGIGCTGTSQTEFPSVYVMMHGVNDPTGTMRNPVRAVPGTTAYHYGGQRAVNWSHYSATCIDPSNPDLLWTLQAYGNSTVDREWCTAWAAFRLPEVERPAAAETSASVSGPHEQELATGIDDGVIQSADSGLWSSPATWDGGRVPGAGARVLIRSGHHVEYDVNSDQAIRGITISGRLSFAKDKDTRLDVGLINIQAGDEYTESGFDCEHHIELPTDETGRPALEVGTPDRPVGGDHTALIRLVYFEGMDKESCPAIVCCAGRMDFHGTPLRRTWLKLEEPADSDDRQIVVQESVDDWRPGDRIIVTSTTRQNKVRKTFQPSTRDSTQTEERTIRSVDGATLTLDRPLEFDHIAEGDYRADVANLSRNVVVESADPEAARGHTMYHVGSRGSISYAEFRHLGKQGVLGRYSLHFHLVGDSMRGSSVIGASIWDSGNRWLTIHGTNYLVVRDCVGYRSVGHGFFMEDGTEVMNVLDRNLAVQAFIGQPLPKQVIPFDKNDGSGFWWANSRNTFTRNVAAECDEYGYFFQAARTPDFDPVLSIRQPDGSYRPVDIRTLPFVRFENNEAHCQRRHAFNLGGGVPFGEPNVGGVGPDAEHPFVIRNMRVWNSHWAIHPVSPSVILDHFQVHVADYGVWRPVYNRHAYHDVSIDDVLPDNHYAFDSGPPPVDGAHFPEPLAPVDDLPPATVITHVLPDAAGRLLVRGTTSDNGQVTQVTVNGQHVRQISPNYAEWETVIDAPRDGKLTAAAEDAAGNVEQTPHVLMREST